MQLAGLAFLFGPALVLVAVAAAQTSAQGWRDWPRLLPLVAVSTAAWLVFVGLFQHETPCGRYDSRCDTVYGWRAPLPDEHPLGSILVLGGFLVPAVLAGRSRLAPPAAVGAALTVGPVALALWTAPRGDNDGLWALIFWYLAILGLLASCVAAVSGRVAVAGERSPTSAGAAPGTTLAEPIDRFGAFGIDLAIVGLVLVAPLTALSHAGLEAVAWVVGIGAAVAYLAVPISRSGRSPGQRLLRIEVVDSGSHRRLPASRAVVRGALLVGEVFLMVAFVGLPLLLEWASMARSRRSLVDRASGTVVVPVPVVVA